MRSSSLPKAPAFRAALTVALALAIAAMVAAAQANPARVAFPGENGKIAFQSHANGPDEIFTINPDGTDHIQLTFNEAFDVSPDISPDGERITFESVGDQPTNPDGDADIYTINADGMGLTNVTNNTDVDESEPVFSPYGNKIAFTSFGARLSNPQGDFEVFTMNADGTGENNVTDNDEALDGRPDWQPEPNQPPVANDAYSVDEDQTLTVDAPGVLLNDLDADGGEPAASLVSGPANGTLTLYPDGSFTYKPNANFNGPVSFTYKASDRANESSTATATITVRPVFDPIVGGKGHHKKGKHGKEHKGKGGGGGVHQSS